MQSLPGQCILFERTSAHAILRLNRPEKLNSLSGEMFEVLSDQLGQLEQDPDLRAVILTGQGDRAFSAGTDILELSSATDSAALSERGQQLCTRIEQFPVPIIAAVNGLAAGGGFELVLACHLRIAASTATFSLPETKLGLMPGYGGTQRLVRELGVGRALEMMLTGRILTSEEASNAGLVNRVVPLSRLLGEALAIADEMAKLSPLSIRSCLRTVIQGLDLSLADGLKLETEVFALLFDTEDVREGTSAFLEKRSPMFRGR